MLRLTNQGTATRQTHRSLAAPGCRTSTNSLFHTRPAPVPFRRLLKRMSSAQHQRLFHMSADNLKPTGRPSAVWPPGSVSVGCRLMSNGAVKRSRASVPSGVRRAGSGGIAWISAGNSSQHCRGVYRAAGHRPDMIHGWGKGEDPGPAHTSQLGFKALICSMAAPSGCGVQLLPRHQKLESGYGFAQIEPLICSIAAG